MTAKFLVCQFARALRLVAGEFWEGKGIFSEERLRDVCRFADLQRFQEINRVIGGGITRVFRAVDERIIDLNQIERFLV